MKVENVMEKIYDPGQLTKAWQQVKKNAGSGGIDNMSIEEFQKRGAELGPLIRKKLEEGNYRFKPARRAFIKKQGTNKMRPLGIPVIMDRIVGQSMYLAFEEIFDHDFSESNYGYRRGRSQHMAIRHVQEIVNEGYMWCACVDLKGFFDNIPHSLILKLIRRQIADERVITLVARMLKSGVIENGKFKATTKGCTQGSPLSPMLSNIVLDELDKKLEERGLRFCRWADDFVILVKSPRAAERVLGSITKYLEDVLELEVNREKSKTGHIKDITFLSFRILRGKIRISEEARKIFKDKVRSLTKRNNPLSMFKIIQVLNEYLRGWVNYFGIQEFKKIFKELDEWIRSRLRSMQLKKWKKPAKFQRIMIKAGYSPIKAKKTWVKMNRWQSTERREVRFTMNLEWFRKWKLVFLNDYTRCNSQASK